MGQESKWWNGFDASYRPILDSFPARSTNALATCAISRLGLKPGQKFLDCPAGLGHISIPLAAHGIRVTGVDLIQSYLDELQKRAKRRKLTIATLCRDMRRINFTNEFDAAANLRTSFGYFEKESDNQLVLRKYFRALKPGGRFMLHTTNRDWIMADFVSHNWFRANDLLVVTHNRFDYETSILHSTWNFISRGETSSHEASVRVYTYHELRNMFEEAGFCDLKGFGSEKNDPISRDHKMMFVIGTKPK
jgi:2-polyprenyl-3-methyl-5-hydroxy-6-metoxy-1,4-benzoquinol methylase